MALSPEAALHLRAHLALPVHTAALLTYHTPLSTSHMQLRFIHGAHLAVPTDIAWCPNQDDTPGRPPLLASVSGNCVEEYEGLERQADGEEEEEAGSKARIFRESVVQVWAPAMGLV